jgi:hypothetical protein
MSLRSIAEQLAHLLGSFRYEVEDLLRRVVRGNFETYRALLAVQRDIAAIPTPVLESPITISDALGRVHRLPSEHFCNWEVSVAASRLFCNSLTQTQMFDTFMRHKFTGFPGESSVKMGQYHVVDERRDWAVVPKERWSRDVFPGAMLSMSIVLTEVRNNSEGCPRDEKHRVSISDGTTSGPIVWLSSHLILL